MPAQASKSQTASKEEAAKKHQAVPTSTHETSGPEGAHSMLSLQRAVADPQTARPGEILALQRKYGNEAVQRLLTRHTIQTKLTVGAANDAYEQEADRVAAQVMSAPAQAPGVQRIAEDEEEIQAKPLAATITPLVQREAAPEEEEELQAKFVQREAAPEEEEELQAKFVQREAAPEEEEIQAKSAAEGETFSPGADFESRLAATHGGGAPLPDQTRDFMEQRFGTDFSNVRLHTGSESAQLNRKISAQAFTQGQDIYLGEGKENVETNEGKQLLAHELTHVVQQNGGAIQRLLVGSGLIQRATKPKTSNKTLKKLTQDLEKAVREDGDAVTPAKAIFKQDSDYYLKLFRYKFEKHRGSNEEKFTTYKSTAFQQENILQAAWAKRGEYKGLIGILCSLLFYPPYQADADNMAEEDPGFFLESILTPLKANKPEASNFLSLLERPAVRDAIKTLNGGNSWRQFVSDIPQFAVPESVHEEIQQAGLVLTPEQIIDRVFDAVVANRKIDVGYYTNNLTLDPGPVNILKNATPEEKAARLERYRQDATKPQKPSLQCDNLMKVLQKVVEMYPGLNTTFAIGMEPQALLTVPLNGLPGGLIPKDFPGNVVDARGNYTNQIFFTGVVDSDAPRSHTWNIIGGKPYDSVLGTKGPEVAGSIEGHFKQKKTDDKWQTVWEDGARTLTKIADIKAAPNRMGFDTAYQRNW